MHSIPTRTLSPFRRNSTNNHDTENTKKKKRLSLRVNTTTSIDQVSTATPSSVRQRLSSLLFRSSSVKEPEQKRASTILTEQEVLPALAIKSTDSLSSSSDNSDHMPPSPGDMQFWQEQDKVISPQLNSLAFQVHQILGSTMDEVDEEIDIDWENSRNKLRQSLIQSKMVIQF